MGIGIELLMPSWLFSRRELIYTKTMNRFGSISSLAFRRQNLFWLFPPFLLFLVYHILGHRGHHYDMISLIASMVVWEVSLVPCNVHLVTI